MAKFLKHPITVTVVSALLLQAVNFAVKQLGGPNPLRTFWNVFVVELWPLWAGLIIGGIYWFVRFLMRLQRGTERGLVLISTILNRLNRNDESR